MKKLLFVGCLTFAGASVAEEFKAHVELAKAGYVEATETHGGETLVLTKEEIPENVKELLNTEPNFWQDTLRTFDYEVVSLEDSEFAHLANNPYNKK